MSVVPKSNSTAQDGSRSTFEKHVFLGEIDIQSRFAARAAERLAPQQNNVDSLDTWIAVQTILIAAANVSKILWPSRASAARGEMLRDLLDVNDSNPLFDRSIRNHFEHYDERIEKWFQNSKSAVYRDLQIGAPTGFLREFPESIQRGYDPVKQTVTFRGQSTDLKAILSALAELHRKCRSIVFL